MTRRLVGLSIVLSVFIVGRAADSRTTLIDLGAEKLPPGRLATWANAGSLGGNFETKMRGGGEVKTVGDRVAVSFDGKEQRFVSSFDAPAGITGNRPFTVAVWAYNQEIGTEECLVQWAHRGEANKCAHLNWGNNESSGAVTHWAADLGYDGGAPSAGEWHHIAVTYQGGQDGLERIWVDGVANTETKRTLDLWPGEPMRLGFTENGHLFSGAMSRVQVFDYALSQEEISFLAKSEGTEPKPALVDLSSEGQKEGPLYFWENRGTLGGGFGQEPSSPKVEEVDGRRAVSFSGRQWLASSMGVPKELGGGSPFTVEVSVFNPEIFSGRESMITWQPIEFVYSKSAKEGAFAAPGAASMGFGGKIPEAGKWHTISYTYTGSETGKFAFYVDGELVLERIFPITAELDKPIRIGAAWDSARNNPATPFTGSISSEKVYDEALTQMEIRKSMGLLQAFSPKPADNSKLNELTTTLSWTSGADKAKSFDVYFGMNAGEVAAATKESALFKGNQPAEDLDYGPVTLQMGKTHFWRVDELNKDGRVEWPGIVWSLRTDDGKPMNPIPRDGRSNVDVGLKAFSWIPGKFANTQNLFFGTDQADTGRRIIPDAYDLAGDVGFTSIPKAKLPLAPGTIYYWRVDQVNGFLPLSKGDLWSFRTADEIVENDITFFASSDLHYNVTDTVGDANRATIDAMNRLPGNVYPVDLGADVIRTPRGVILTGDLTNSGLENEWRSFCGDWGVNGEGMIGFPVYEICGNHDGGPEGPVRQGIRERNERRPGLAEVSETKLHYSWDWDQVHFVNLSLFPGSKVRDDTRGDPEGSLEFLTKDLAENVGTSGRPVFISQHFGYDGWGLSWWEAPDVQDAFYNAIKDYNVIGLLFGHSHAAAIGEWRGIATINVASTQRDPEPGEFFVFHIKDNRMTIAHRFLKNWGEVRKTVEIKGVKPAVPTETK